MKAETKLLIRKRVLMTLRAILWHADEWLHRQEVKYRDDLSARKTRTDPAASRSEKPGGHQDMLHRCPGRAENEAFQQWEARKSGIAVVSKKQSRERRRVSSAEFDLRFAR